MTFVIHKHTSIRMDGTRDLIEVLPETFASYTAATVRAMELEAEARGTLHNGRTIQFDAKEQTP